MSQQQLPQQQTAQQTGQQFTQSQQTFGKYVPQQVSQTVYQLEQIESDAEWAHGRAMQAGDSFTAKKLADLAQIVHLQKNLLLRESDLAQTVSQCTQQALQQCGQQLQRSQIPGVKQVAQQAQQLARTVPQASSQVAQLSGQSQRTGGQSQQMGGQSRLTGQGQSY